MRNVVVINGPNLNLLGVREPEVYGTATLADLEQDVTEWGSDLGLSVQVFQSNHEGALIDRIHSAREEADGLVINAGALSHTSYAIHDAIAGVGLPAVEVHISNIKQREEWRRHSVTAPACVASIYGRGFRGYRDALRHLVARSAWEVDTIAYGSTIDEVGDLRLPAGEGPHAIVVLVHGGFWRDPWKRDLMDLAAVDLTRRGWATWNIEYRRVGSGGGWPTTLEDVGAAFDAVLEIGNTHPVDLSRVVALGHSAGGHLALWAAGRSRLRSPAPGAGPLVQPAAVAGLAPVADLEAGHRLGVGDGAVEEFLRRTPEDGPERYAVASPPRLLPLGVPQLIAHGDADDRVPIDLSRNYAGAAADAGDRVIYHELDGVDHFDVIEPGTPGWQSILDEIDDLL